MNHKRHRPRRQRAGCYCGGKRSKKQALRGTRGDRPDWGTRGSELRLWVRVQEESV